MGPSRPLRTLLAVAGNLDLSSSLTFGGRRGGKSLLQSLLLKPEKRKTGRRESKLYMRLHTIPEGEHCIHRDAVNGVTLPWGSRPHTPKGISSLQWRKMVKRWRRRFDEQTAILSGGNAA